MKTKYCLNRRENKAQLMRLCFLNVEKTIVNTICDNFLINDGDNIVIALSGGADSVCLFRMLVKISEVMNLNLHAVHVNHMIRGQEAYNDADFCRKLCEKYCVEFSCFEKNVPFIAEETSLSEEECGRLIRYECLNEVAAGYKNAKIAVAHNMNDQAETVLFRMMRGTGIKGLGGMDYINGNIIRPLLDVLKEDIVDYLNRINQPYRNDYTNEQNEYSRNMIRNIYLKAMENDFPKTSAHMVWLAKEAREIEKYLEDTAKALYERIKVPCDKGTCIEIISECDSQVIFSRIIRLMIEEVSSSLKDYSSAHIEAVINLVDSSESKMINLPYGVIAKHEANRLYIYMEEAVDISDSSKKREMAAKKEKKRGSVEVIPIDKEGEYRLGKYVFRVTILKASENKKTVDKLLKGTKDLKSCTKWMDYDRISDGLCLRTRCSGDYLVVDLKGSKKKLSDYMINEKIPKSHRDSVPIFAIGSKVCLVVGYRMSEDVKVTVNTRDIIQIEMEEK